MEKAKLMLRAIGGWLKEVVITLVVLALLVGGVFAVFCALAAGLGALMGVVSEGVRKGIAVALVGLLLLCTVGLAGYEVVTSIQTRYRRLKRERGIEE